MDKYWLIILQRGCTSSTQFPKFFQIWYIKHLHLRQSDRWKILFLFYFAYLYLWVKLNVFPYLLINYILFPVTQSVFFFYLMNPLPKGFPFAHFSTQLSFILISKIFLYSLSWPFIIYCKHNLSLPYLLTL